MAFILTGVVSAAEPVDGFQSMTGIAVSAVDGFIKKGTYRGTSGRALEVMESTAPEHRGGLQEPECGISSPRSVTIRVNCLDGKPAVDEVFIEVHRVMAMTEFQFQPCRDFAGLAGIWIPVTFSGPKAGALEGWVRQQADQLLARVLARRGRLLSAPHLATLVHVPPFNFHLTSLESTA